jgi:hypothetical protein
LGSVRTCRSPIPKAEAPAEAKRWLQTLTEAEVGPALAALDRGTLRPIVTAEGLKPGEAPVRPRTSAHDRLLQTTVDLANAGGRELTEPGNC